MTNTTGLLAAAALVAIVLPVAWWMKGAWAGRDDALSSAWSWRAVSGSALACVLAFNLTFFVQEIFLVVPKAFTPGLQPTLFHNNHMWKGEHPLAALFQGTGALATAVIGLLCLYAVRRGAGRTPAARMFGVWMAYCGLLMALPQVVIGALSSGSDVGMAMDYLRMTPMAKTVAAVLALAAIPCVALALVRPVIEIGGEDATTPRSRARRVFQYIVLPSLIAMLLVVPFRVPREWIEVVLLPVLVLLPGVLWMQAAAWRATASSSTVPATRVQGNWSLGRLAAAAIVLLLVFQCVLRPGVAFY